MDADEENEAFLSEVCWHYFISEMTQSEIADLLSVTRVRVNKAIQAARRKGLVRIELQTPFAARMELQQELCRQFGLRQALVAPANRTAHDYHQPTGAALAAHLEAGLAQKKWRSIGVSWGMTLEAAIRRLPRMDLPGLEIVSTMGGTSTGATFNAFGVAAGMANRLGASYSLLAAPIYLSAGTDRERFLSEEVFQNHLRKCQALDVALLVAGDLSTKSFLIRDGLPSSVPPRDLADRGAVGDVLGRFLDRDGNLVDHPINGRAVGIDLDQLHSIPEVVLAASGLHKVDIIIAAIRRGFVDTLVTDDVTAERVLERAR